MFESWDSTGNGNRTKDYKGTDEDCTLEYCYILLWIKELFILSPMEVPALACIPVVLSRAS